METNKFSVVMSEKVDMELVRIVTSERADYQPEAVIAAEEELKRRNITPSMYQDYTKEVEKLIEVEKKNFDAEEFMLEIKDMLRELIQTYEIVKDAEVLMHPVYEPVGKCPACGNDVVEKQKGFFCSNRQCRFALWKGIARYDT